MKLSISSTRIIIWLVFLIILLNSIGSIGRAIENYFDYEGTTTLVRLFHVSGEGNITNWFSSLLLLLSGIILAIIAKAKSLQNGPYVRHWIGLSIIFIYLSLDEAASIHELTIGPLRSFLNPSGFFHFAWVIIALPLVLLFFIIYLKFIIHLPRDTRWLFIIAGLLYVSGAMGMDMVAGYILNNDLEHGHIYGILITIEELMENVGILVFIFALLSYIKLHLQVTEIKLELI